MSSATADSFADVAMALLSMMRGNRHPETRKRPVQMHGAQQEHRRGRTRRVDVRMRAWLTFTCAGRLRQGDPSVGSARRQGTTTGGLR
ncbi:hypothetical protein HMPREF3102_04175 [Micrococcus sp. HMSC30C05]|nr:hypothetical protein HMPREF3102_04175 [Micrococcus sp. HMSC30C05]